MLDFDTNMFIILTFLLTLMTSVPATIGMRDYYWEAEAIAHGAGNYVISNNNTVFKWNDEIKLDEYKDKRLKELMSP